MSQPGPDESWDCTFDFVFSQLTVALHAMLPHVATIWTRVLSKVLRCKFHSKSMLVCCCISNDMAEVHALFYLYRLVKTTRLNMADVIPRFAADIKYAKIR